MERLKRFAAGGLAAGMILGSTAACEGNGAPEPAPVTTANCTPPTEFLGSFPQTDLPAYLGEEGTEKQTKVWKPIKQKAKAAKPSFPGGGIDITYGYQPQAGANDMDRITAERSAESVEIVAAEQLGISRLWDKSDASAIKVGTPAVTIFLVGKCK